MPESRFAREQCQQCRRPATHADVTEYFELRYTVRSPASVSHYRTA